MSWIGKMDVGSLKNKVFFSVVSISTMQLPGLFMESKNIPNDKIIMYIELQLCFVITSHLRQGLEKMSLIQCRLNCILMINKGAVYVK